MAIWKQKCAGCNEFFLTKANARKYCPACVEKRNYERSKKMDITEDELQK